jgi:hypothetical protein
VRWTTVPVMEFTCPKCELTHGVPDQSGEAAAYLKGGNDSAVPCQGCGVALRIYHSDILLATEVVPS